MTKKNIEVKFFERRYLKNILLSRIIFEILRKYLLTI